MISMFLEIFRPYKHVLVTLLEIQKANFLHFYKRACFCCHHGISKITIFYRIPKVFCAESKQCNMVFPSICLKRKIPDLITKTMPIFPFALKLHTQHTNFYSMVLCSVGSDFYKKCVLDLWVKSFGLRCLSAFVESTRCFNYSMGHYSY